MPLKTLELPNGRLLDLDVPDGTPDDAVIQFAAQQFAANPELGYKEPTALGQVGETLKGIPRGFLSSFATAGEGLGQLANAATDMVGLEGLIDEGDDNELVRLARAGRRKVQETLGADPGYEDRWMTKFGDALGSLASFLTPATALRVLGSTSKLKELGVTLPMVTGMGSGESSQRVEQARAQGIDVDQDTANLAVLFGGAIGLSELAPVGMILRGLPREVVGTPFFKSLMPRLKSALASGTVEGAQEVSAQILQDLNEKGLYNPNLEVGQTALDEFTLGGAAGAAADLLLNAVAGRRLIAVRAQEKEREDELRVAERERLARKATKEFPESRAEAEGTVAGALPYLPPEAPKDPTRDALNRLADEVIDQRGDQFPINATFTSLDTDGQPGLQVRDPQGNVYGPTFGSPAEAATFANVMNGRVIDRSVDAKVDLAIDQSGNELGPVERSKMRMWVRRVFNPSENAYTPAQVNLAAGTLMESGYANEAMTAREALEAGVPMEQMTAAQQINARRLERGLPETVEFSPKEVKQVLGDKFNRIHDYQIAPIGRKEKFNARLEGETPVIESSLNDKPDRVIKDRPTTLAERAANPELGERVAFKDLQEAKNYAKMLQASDTVMRNQLGAVDEITLDDIRNVLRSKNIEYGPNLESPELRSFAEQVAGLGYGKRVEDMSAGERAAVYHKLRALPEFERPTRLPNFAPRPYSADHYAAAKQIAMVRPAADISTLRKSVEETAGTTLTDRAWKALTRDIRNDARLQEQREAAVAEENAAAAARAEAEAAEAALRAEQEQQQKGVDQAVRKALKGYSLDSVRSRIMDVVRYARRNEAGETELGDPQVGTEVRGAYIAPLNEIFIAIDALKARPEYQALADADAATKQAMLEKLALETLNHEIIHAMRRADLFTQQEWEILENAARRMINPETGTSYADWAVRTYERDGLSPTQIMEEAIAEMTSHSISRLDPKTGKRIQPKLKISGRPAALMKRIWDFLKGIVQLNQEGFYRFDDIISGIRSGEIGAREQGKIRTLKDTERIDRGGIIPERGIVPGLGTRPIARRPARPTAPDQSGAMPEPSPAQRGTAQARQQGRRPDYDVAMQRVMEENPGLKEVQDDYDISDTQFSRRLERAVEQGFDISTVWWHGRNLSDRIRDGRDTTVDKFRTLRGVAGYFTLDKKFAENFAMGEYGDRENGYMMPVFLRVNDSFDPYNGEHLDRLAEVFNDPAMESEIRRLMFEHFDRGGSPPGQTGDYADIDVWFDELQEALFNVENELFSWRELEAIIPLMKLAGFDSYYDYEYTGEPTTGIAVFERGNIKGAFAEFNPDAVPEGMEYDDDIMFQRVMDQIPAAEELLKLSGEDVRGFKGALLRALMQGFDIANVWMHGTTRTQDNIKRFKGRRGVAGHFTQSIDFANQWAGTATVEGGKKLLATAQLGLDRAVKDLKSGFPNPYFEERLRGGSVYPVFLRLLKTFNPEDAGDLTTVAKAMDAAILPLETSRQWYMEAVERTKDLPMSEQTAARWKLVNQFAKEALSPEAYAIRMEHQRYIRMPVDEQPNWVPDSFNAPGVHVDDIINQMLERPSRHLKDWIMGVNQPHWSGLEESIPTLRAMGYDSFYDYESAGDRTGIAVFHARDIKSVFADFNKQSEAALREGYENDISFQRVTDVVEKSLGKLEWTTKPPGTEAAADITNDLCIMTSNRTVANLRKQGIPSGRGHLKFLVPGTKDRYVGHYVALAEVDGQRYIVDDPPQNLYVVTQATPKWTEEELEMGLDQFSSGQKIRVLKDTFDPKFIALTPENLANYYGLDAKYFAEEQRKIGHIPPELREFEGMNRMFLLAQPEGVIQTLEEERVYAMGEDVSYQRVIEATDKTLTEATERRTDVGRFSQFADPQAQYVARYPERGRTIDWENDPDVQFMVNGPALTAAEQDLLDTYVPDSPKPINPYQHYYNAAGVMDSPGKLSYWLTKFKQAAINKYARLEQLNIKTHLRENLADTSSISAALMADRSLGILSAAIRYGVPVYRNGTTQVLSEGEGGFKSLIDVMAPLYSKRHGNLTKVAQLYAITRRAERISAEGKDVPVPDGERARVDQMIQQFTENGRNIIEDWYADWQTYNDFTIRFMEDTGVIDSQQADTWRQYADYYPFYKVTEGGGKQFRQGRDLFGGMTAAAALKELKGSESAINMDMLEAISLNLSAAIQMGMKNIAQQRIARDMIELGLGQELQGVQQSDAPVVEFRVGGKKRRVAIYDPLVYESMLPLDGTETVSAIRKTFGLPATALRELVTRDPGFMMVNLLRDSLSSYTTSGANLKPIYSTMKGLTDGIERLEKLGVVGGYDYSNDPQDIKKFYDLELRKAGILPDGHMHSINLFKRLWNGLGRATSASDGATRNAVFDDVFKRTGNLAEAQFQAMEVINFGRHGRHPLVRILTSIVPFLNARFQGLDVFYRAFTGQYTANKDKNRQQVIMTALLRSSLMVSGTLAYYMLVSDDDQYKEAPDFVKDNNWLIPTSSGVPVTLPIPFEVGLLFKTIPETIAATVAGEKSGKEAFDTVFKRGIGATLEISPFQIQFAGPIMEAVTNYNSFTGRQVVPQYLMDSRTPGAQATVYTSELAKAIGETFNISPMKVEHTITGYAGTMGTYVYDLIDTFWKGQKADEGGANVMPARPWYDYPIIKRWVGKQNDSGMVQDAYDLYRDVEKVNSTFKSLREDGRTEEAMAYIYNREHLLAMRGNVGNIKKMLDKVRQQKEMILQSDMSREEKRERIDSLDAYLNGMLRDVVPTLKKMADMPFYEPLYY